MSRVSSFAAAGFGLALAMALATVSTMPTLAQEAPPPRLPAAEGDALVSRMCNECHDSRTVTSRRRTRTEWEHSISDMIQEGATGSAKDFENVWAYLVQTRGRVFINDAPADEIAQVLGVGLKEAEAIVAFRTKNGPFADLTGLKKVPDLDAKILDAQADAIAY